MQMGHVTRQMAERNERAVSLLVWSHASSLDMFHKQSITARAKTANKLERGRERETLEFFLYSCAVL